MAERLDQAMDRCPADLPQMERLKAGLAWYRPIDWQVDFKSGYRWDPRTWHMDIPIGRDPGVDVKVPWELSRGHHLVALALAGSGCQVDGASDELSLQLVDWVAANPVRFGVNWRSAMDTSIRAANWCWALALAGPDAVPSPIRGLIGTSLYEHGIFVESHLDYVRVGTNNHYLADIVGLLHIAAALPGVPESDRWAALSIQELVSEMERVVTRDGASYEGSTGYHRLVAEMFHHGTLAAMRLPLERRVKLAQMRRQRRRSPTVEPGSWAFDPTSALVFPNWYHERLRSMGDLTEGLTKPNGLVPQFGDQDSGRFLKFDWPAVIGSPDFVEEPRQHKQLLSTAAGLYREDRSELDPYPLERAAGTVTGITIKRETRSGAPDVVRHEWNDGESVWYPDGGYYVARSGPFWICVRCEDDPGDAPMGHRHNDQLSFELNVDGVDIFVDSGSGVYTANTHLRNELRSTGSHSTVSVTGAEQRALPAGLEGLFSLHDGSRAQVISNGPGTFAAVHRWAGNVHRRSFETHSNSLVIKDHIETEGSWSLNYVVPPEVTITVEQSSCQVSLTRESISLVMGISDGNATITKDSLPYAPAYGRIESATRLTIKPMDDSCITTIKLLP
jgi:hypothetical protein